MRNQLQSCCRQYRRNRASDCFGLWAIITIGLFLLGYCLSQSLVSIYVIDPKEGKMHKVQVIYLPFLSLRMDEIFVNSIWQSQVSTLRSAATRKAVQADFLLIKKEKL